MSNFYFGVLMGVFLYFGGSRLYRKVLNAFKRRTEDNEQKEKEKMQEMIHKVVDILEEKIDKIKR